MRLEIPTLGVGIGLAVPGALGLGVLLAPGQAHAAGLGDPLLYDMLAFLGYAAMYCMAGLLGLATGYEYVSWRRTRRWRTRQLAYECLGWTVLMLAIPFIARTAACEAGAHLTLCSQSLMNFL